MSRVNFLDEFRSIMRYASQNGLSMRERMFWIALFYIANDRAVYNKNAGIYEWPDGYFPVSNSELNLYGCLDKRGVDSIRNQLKQRGILEFTKGMRNSKNPMYKLNYLSPHVGCKNVPNDVPNNVPNNVPNDAPNSVPNNVPKVPPLPKTKETGLDKTKASETATPSPSGEDGDGGSITNLIHYAMDKLCDFKDRDAERIADFATQGMGAAVIRKAIDIAVAYGHPNFTYAYSILCRYRRSGITTIYEAALDDRAHAAQGKGHTGNDLPVADLGDDFYYDPSKDYPEIGTDDGGDPVSPAPGK